MRPVRDKGHWKCFCRQRAGARNLVCSSVAAVIPPEDAMGRVLALVNHKGGVGKTTTTVNLAHALAAQQKKVLVVDLDTQCNATGMYLAEEPKEHSLYELLDDGNPSEIRQCIAETCHPGLALLPNVHETLTLEPVLAASDGMGYRYLRDRLRGYAQSTYDYTLLDCPPNLGLFAVQAMAAADAVIIPLEAGSRFSYQGLEHTLDAILAVQKNFNPDLQTIRLLANKVDRRTSVCRITMDQVRSHFGDKTLNAEIPMNTAIQQAELLRMSVLDYAAKSKGALAYCALADEVAAIWA